MAETRETQVLEDVVESTEIENPRTTEEAILAQVIAGEEVTINARTRLQKYLSQLTSGGASITVEALSATENKTYTAPEGKAYSPVTVAVPNPNSVEIITGTADAPFGGYSAKQIADAVSEYEITAYLAINLSSLGTGTYKLCAMLDAITDIHISFGLSGWSNSGWVAGYASYRYAGSAISELRMLQQGNDIDLLAYASNIPATLIIIHHPLSEDNT